MLKLSKWIQNYLVWSLPFVAICMVWSAMNGGNYSSEDYSGLTSLLWEALSYNLMFWFVLLITFFALLVVHTSVREQTLKRISNIKDRDEREEQITGRASKRAYISTFALLLLLLFLSAFQVNVRHIPLEEQVGGNTKTLSIGMGFSIFDEPRVEAGDDGQVIFEAKDIPLSKSGVLILVLGWLIVSYNVSVRRELKQG